MSWYCYNFAGFGGGAPPTGAKNADDDVGLD